MKAAESSFQPVYFFPGPEVGQKQERINSIRRKLAARDKEEPEYYKYYPYDTHVSEIISLLQNGSLFSSRRLVVFADIHALNAEGIKALQEYIAAPSPEAVLILTTDQSPGSRGYPRKATDSLPKAAVEVFWEMFEKNKRGWVSHFFREKGLRIDSDAVDTLLDVTEGTTDALKEACERLSYSVNPNHIVDEETVDRVLEHGRNETVYSVFDRFCRRDLYGVLEAYHKMIHADPGTGDRFLMMFADPLIHLMDFKIKVSQGLTEESAALELKLRGGKRALQSYRNGSQKYSRQELKRAVHTLVDLESWLRNAPHELRSVRTDLWLCRIMGSQFQNQHSRRFG